MTQIFDDTRAVPVTVIKAGPCFVAQIKTEERDGYDAVQLAFGEPRATGHEADAGPLRRERRPSPGATWWSSARTTPSHYEPGQEIRADVFAAGERADVVGVSKGKGFAGVMKRHGFGGLRASHGTQRKHRAPGSIGACATPSRVFKGMRMAGPDGQRAGHRAEPGGRAGRPRAQPAARAGRGARARTAASSWCGRRSRRRRRKGA